MLRGCFRRQGSGREAFLRRRGPDAFWLATSDPDRALGNLMQRDRIFTDAVAVEAGQAGLPVLPVDGTRAPDELAADLADRFGLHR